MPNKIAKVWPIRPMMKTAGKAYAGRPKLPTGDLAG